MKRLTAQDIERKLQRAIAAHPGCRGARFLVTVHRVEGDEAAGAWTAEFTAIGEPPNRETCEAAVASITALALNTYRLALDS